MYKLNHMRVNILELIICLTNAGDLISPELANHHQQVAYLAFKIAEQLDLPKKPDAGADNGRLASRCRCTFFERETRTY